MEEDEAPGSDAGGAVDTTRTEQTATDGDVAAALPPEIESFAAELAGLDDIALLRDLALRVRTPALPPFIPLCESIHKFDVLS